MSGANYSQDAENLLANHHSKASLPGLFTRQASRMVKALNFMVKIKIFGELFSASAILGVRARE